MAQIVDSDRWWPSCESINTTVAFMDHHDNNAQLSRLHEPESPRTSIVASGDHPEEVQLHTWLKYDETAGYLHSLWIIQCDRHLRGCTVIEFNFIFNLWGTLLRTSEHPPTKTTTFLHSDTHAVQAHHRSRIPQLYLWEPLHSFSTQPQLSGSHLHHRLPMWR